MSDPSNFIIGIIGGFLVALGLAALAQRDLLDRAVASGYLVHGQTAYRLVPTPNPNRSE